MRNVLMTRGAFKIATQCAGVKPGESAVVVCDHRSRQGLYSTRRRDRFSDHAAPRWPWGRAPSDDSRSHG